MHNPELTVQIEQCMNLHTHNVFDEIYETQPFQGTPKFGPQSAI